MVHFKDISKEDFLAAYEQHLPAKWIKFAFKYFSKETEVKDMKPKKIIIGFLLAFFLVGLFGTVFNLSRSIILPVTLAYSILLAILVLFLFAAVFANNWRLKKVMKILGVNKVEYNQLADLYFDK